MDTQSSWAASTTALAPTFLLFFGVILVADTNVLAAAGWRGDALHLLLELRVGDFGGRLNILGGDDTFGRRWSFLNLIARDTTSDAEQLNDIVELPMKISANGDGGRDGLDVGF